MCETEDGRTDSGPDRPLRLAVVRLYRLLNWNRFRAPGRPGFFRSTARGSRVSSPRPAAWSVLPIGLDQRAGDGQPQRAGLTRLPAAIHVRLHIEARRAYRWR